ncbi:hypothetical protein [Nodularia spumigena]|uniref:Uncharacterized protein n=1 Tax=Nodularia spumigena UHCC 0039 TaxID=1914872 RepID=A0A2S0QA91_NODSP|nr:hypothetical protein [Nodularia spumigena]AVZ31333.1 hypothetical protein BMF81_03976 [Nodularia spumigena UHCC 0039]
MIINFNLNLPISIPTDVILEWQNGINDGIATNQWWQSLTKDQQKLLLEKCLVFLQQQKIKESKLESKSLVPSLIQLSKSAGELELSQDAKNRFVISGRIDRNLYGVWGKCYSQSPEFVGSMCNEFLGGYLETSSNHEHGQKTVDVICCALNALPGITAAQTPSDSVADVGLRWDVIIKWNDCYFPIQVKSSFIGIEKALETGNLGNYAQEKIEKISTHDNKLYESEQRFIERAGKDSPEERANKKAYYQSRRENRSHIRHQYVQSAPIYIWAGQNKETIQLLVELFANTFKIDNNIKQYQEQAVAAYLEKYPKEKSPSEKRQERLNKINEQKKEQAEQIIQALKEQIQGKQKRIRNRKARKRPVVIEHNQALKIAENTLQHIQQLMEDKNKLKIRLPLFGSTITKVWYSDQTLFKNIKKLRDIDKETNSPMLQKTEELFTLIQDFTEIRETLIGELDEEFDYIGNIGV